MLYTISKITRSAISQKLINQKKRKRSVFWRIYFYTSIPVLGLKFKTQMAENLQILWVYVEVYTEVYVGLCRSTWRFMLVYTGLGNIIQSKYVPMMSLAVVGTLTNQILWVYVGLGNIIQSKYVPMMSLAVVGTLTNQILWVYMGLRRGLHGSTQVYVEVYVGLRRGLRRSTWGWGTLSNQNMCQ